MVGPNGQPERFRREDKDRKDERCERERERENGREWERMGEDGTENVERMRENGWQKLTKGDRW